MKSVIILALLALAISSDIIMVGDSRTYLLAQDLFPIFQGYDLVTTDHPVYYGKHTVRFDCKPGARIYDFKSGTLLGNFLEKLLRSSAGSYVFLWVGVNNVNVPSSYQETLGLYVSLAKKYRAVNFIVFSIPGVNDRLIAGHHPATNQLVMQYNNYMRAGINAYSQVLRNLRYVDIVNPANPLVTTDGYDINPYLDEIGLHFNAIACKYFFDKMIQYLPDK